MPVISFISPKGGVGKTTSAVMLACQLARSSPVTIIDADPNEPVSAWAKRPGCPENITVVKGITQDNIEEEIDRAVERTPFVIVDCEGTASVTVMDAIAAANLVIIPTQGSQLDARQAGEALKLIRKAERRGAKIPTRILFTRTSSVIRTKNLDAVQKQFRDAGVLMFDTHMHEREAFRAVFSIGGTLEALDPKAVANGPKAIANARGLLGEVVAVLREEGQGA